MRHTAIRMSVAVLSVLVTVPACGTIGAINRRPGPPVSDATQVAAGVSTACAIRARGEVWCWGATGYGSLKGTPTAVTPHRIPGIRRATQIEVGLVGGCAVDETRSLWCWSAGQNDSPAFFVAKRAAVDDVSAVALNTSGNTGKCAVAGRDRHIVCWSRYSGRWEPSPDLAQVTGVSSLSLVGDLSGCAIVAGGRVSCWQIDWSARTANDPFPLVVSPIEGIEGATVLESSTETTCAALTGGSVRCWTTEDPTPRLVSLPVDGGSISLSFGRMCGIAADGVVVCRQLGKAAPYEAEPHTGRWEVPGSGDAVQVDLGSQFGCMVTSTREVRCWGVNRDDQLGRGPGGPSASPEAGPVRTS